MLGNTGDDIILGDGGYITRNPADVIEKSKPCSPTKAAMTRSMAALAPRSL
ncbi:MAG: hypothetical protein HC881_03995 [Leptolyngbyaceae cyanobacterium SL_7_1]|nr:hypothetical protein [Leptolyngbyaceae cyanobacterium SL_7_1]